MIPLLKKIINHPWLVMLIILAITGLFMMQIRQHARMETNLDDYMPKDHPAFVYSDTAEDWFGIKDAVVIAIENKNGIYEQGTLEKVVALTKRLQKLKDIDKGDVISLSTADNIIGSEDGLDVRPFFKRVPKTPEKLAVLREAVRGNEMIFGRLVSRDETVTMIIAELEDDAFSQELHQQILALRDEFQGPETIYVAGRPVVEGTMALLGPADMKRMIPIVALVIVMVLFLSLLSIKATAITLAIVFLSTIWVFGLMSALRIPVYAVSTMIPVMLIAIGVADSIHLFNHLTLFRREHPTASKSEAITNMLQEMWLPVVMTSVTTSLGFISLLTSQVYPIKYFGLFTAFGVMMAMVFSLVFLPAGIMLLGMPKMKKEKAGAREKRGFFHLLADKIIGHQKVVIALTVIIALAAIGGTTKIWIDSSFLANFEKDSEIVQADKFVNEHFGGTSKLNVVLEGEADIFKQPDVWRRVETLQKQLEELSEVGDTFALNDYLRRMHKVMNEDREEYNVIPDSRDLIAQYLLLYSMSGDPENLDRVVDYDYKRANLQVSLKGDNSHIIKTAIALIEQNRENFPKLDIQYAGSGYKGVVFTDLIFQGQISSLFISVLLIIFVLALMFRSLIAGLIGVIPIVLTVFIGFGIMGYLNLPLNSTTALLASIAIGIGIDYVIHFTERFKINVQRYSRGEVTSLLQAVYETMTHSGRAIAYNALVVIAGFAVLLFSVFPPNRALGAMVSLNMFDAFVATLTIMMLILYLAKPRFLFGKSKEKHHPEVQN